MEFIELLQSATPIEGFLLGVFIVYLLFKGVLKLPFINVSNIKRYDDVIDRHIKIIRIKTIDTLYEQMSSLEVLHDDITLKMRSIYNEMATNEKDIDHYNLLVSSMEHEIKGVIRKWFKENHFTSRSETEFDIYVNQKVDHLINRVIYHLDTRYKGYEVSRDELKKANERDLIPLAKSKFRQAFYSARDISRIKESIMENLGNESKNSKKVKNIIR